LFHYSYEIVSLIKTHKMAKKINVEKILKEISKGDVTQQVEAFNQLKQVLSENLQKKHAELQVLNSLVAGVQPSNN